MLSRSIFPIRRALAVLLAACCMHAHALPSMSLVIPDRYVGKGELFSIFVHIDDVHDLFAYQFDLTFDPALLSVRAVEEGNFMAGPPHVFFPGTVDSAGGRISFVVGSLTDDTPALDGSGDLVRIAFRAGDAAGTASFSLPNVILLDSSLADMPFAPPGGGEVQVVAAPGTLTLVLTMLPLLLWTARSRGRRIRR